MISMRCCYVKQSGLSIDDVPSQLFMKKDKFGPLGGLGPLTVPGFADGSGTTLLGNWNEPRFANVSQPFAKCPLSNPVISINQLSIANSNHDES